MTFTAEEYAEFLASESTFPPEVYKTIEDLAKRKKVSMAWIVREAWKSTSRISGREGSLTYLYRAVEKQGRTVEFLLSERRDVVAAKRFFRKAMKTHATPRVITLGAYAASHRALPN